MTDPVADVLAEVVERIVPPDGPTAHELPADVTGALAGLWTWWAAVGSGRPVARVVSPASDAGARTVVSALADGLADADRAVDAGATLLVPRARTRSDAVARTAIALLTRREASAVLHQPPGMSDREWMVACATVRDGAARAADLRGEPLAMLDRLEAPELAYLSGVLLAAAARRTACLVDGTDELAAALVADRLCYRAKGWWLAATDSPDPGRAAAIDRIDLAVGLPLALSDDAGRGADAVTALLTDVVPLTP